MSRVLDMMWTAIATTGERLLELLGVPAESVPGLLGPGLVIAAVVLLLLVLFLLLPGGRSEGRVESRPELLVSRGEVRPNIDSSITELSMQVSNLGDGVAQLLEVALSTELMPNPETAEISELVPRSRSVEVSTPVEELQGDSGFLDLYFYTPQTRNRAFRLRARLTWEPWNGRYKVEPLGQRIDPARRLASSRLQRRQRDEWRKRRDLLDETAGVPVDPRDHLDEEARDERSGRDRGLEFPSDF